MDQQKKTTFFPNSPGVYFFYNAAKEVIYIGKATSLKNRVQSYFNTKKRDRPIEKMMHEVVDIKVEKTDSVLEAVILEANSIKAYAPRYNVIGKDNRSWNYVVITDDMYPKVETVRQHTLDGNRDLFFSLKQQQGAVFGPYPGLNTKVAMKILQRLFYFSTCKSGAKRPCLNYQMGKCLGVCVGKITSLEYKKQVIAPLKTFLRGGKKEVVYLLQKRMITESKKHNYEDAARLRDQIRSLERIHDIALINTSFTTTVFSHAQDEVLHIEGYDISHFGGKGAVGSMVVFEGAYPIKKKYRSFGIKKAEPGDDVACLVEVLERRLLRANSWSLPHLFLVDGGKGQVNAIKNLLKSNNIYIPVVGIAKGPARKKNEFIVDVQPSRELIRWVGKNRHTLISVRDEAHRFALRRQKSKRKIR